MKTRRPTFVHAARVAVVTTAVLMALYVLVAALLDVVMVDRLTHQVDQRLASVLATAAAASSPQSAAVHLSRGNDLDDAPLIFWSVDPSGRTTLLSSRGPTLPRRAWSTSPKSASFAGGSFRLEAKPLSGGNRLVAGESLAEVRHVRSVLLLAEALVAPFIVAAVFFLSLVVGLRAAAPVEQARKRQLELTADASHELRTPLSVIEAEVSLALGQARRAVYYRSSLERVASESRRLRRIVEDLLWLARFDSEPPPSATEPVELNAAAGACVERFGAVAARCSIALAARQDSSGPVLVKVAPEWLDRLLGVLVDNALRYSPAGGRVSVTVLCHDGRARLGVEDSGPGIPEGELDRLFDRFHRASDKPGGAGLGLAIADAVVRSSDGRWHIGSSPSGGARMEVSWAKVHPRDATPSGPEAGPAHIGAEPVP